MLENIEKLVRQYAGDAIISNPAIPNERNEEVMADAASSIASGLKTAVASGNVDGLLAFFKSDSQSAASSPVTQNIQAGFTQNLMNKFGLDQGKASQIAGSLIPMVLQKLVQQTNDPNDSSFDLPGLLGSLTGGGGALGGLLNKLGNNNENTRGEDLLGKIKGMF